MSPSVALAADKPEKSSAVVRIVLGMATVNGRGKCMMLSAPLVVKRRRYLSSLEKGDPCTAATVTLRSDARPRFRKGNTKREGGINNASLSLSTKMELLAPPVSWFSPT